MKSWLDLDSALFAGTLTLDHVVAMIDDAGQPDLQDGSSYVHDRIAEVAATHQLDRAMIARALLAAGRDMGAARSSLDSFRA